MSTSKPSSEQEGVEAAPDQASVTSNDGKLFDPWWRSRLCGAIVWIVLLVVVFWVPILSVVRLALTSELNSHIVLIPFISTYLIYIRCKQLPKQYSTAYGPGLMLFVIGVAAWMGSHGSLHTGSDLGMNASLSWATLSFVCFLVAGGFLFLGWRWMSEAAFPIAFLIFMIPLPAGLVSSLETASKLASAEAADLLFSLTSTPVMRDGTVFVLPGIIIEVAQECSGIRSSFVLVMTGLLAAYLFLKNPWRRALIVAVVIPLGIIRNGFRILVIALLCVHLGPQMIDSPIHHRGGPLFFALSLIPLFLLMWWLRRSEAPKPNSTNGTDGGASG